MKGWHKMTENEKPVKLPFSKTLFAIHNLQSAELPTVEGLKSTAEGFLELIENTPSKVQPPTAQPTREQSDSKNQTSPSQEEQVDASGELDDDV